MKISLKAKKMPVKKKTSKKYTFALGRRKEATATVRLYQGEGVFKVNGRMIGDYFPGSVNKFYFQKPLKLTQNLAKFHGDFAVKGGGKKSQLEAVVLALARALGKVDREKYRPILKKQGLFTVDSRTRERRKAGQMGRARKKKQSPKR